MNRIASIYVYTGEGVPRARGDEPFSRQSGGIRARVFPAPAGMNRERCAISSRGSRVPRARGDEPQVSGTISATIRCSPRPRG